MPNSNGLFNEIIQHSNILDMFIAFINKYIYLYVGPPQSREGVASEFHDPGHTENK